MAPLDMSSSSAAPTFVPTGPACALPLLLARASTSSSTKQQDGNAVIPALQLLDSAVLDLAFGTSTACGVPQPCAASAAVGLQQLASVSRSADESKDEDDLDLIINTSAFASEVGGALLLHRCSSPSPSSVHHGATSDHSEQLALSTCNWDEVLQPVPHSAFTLHQEEEEQEEQEQLAADLLLPSAAEDRALTDLEDGEEGSPSPSTTTSSLHEAVSEHVDSAPAASSGAPHVVVQLRRQSVVHRPALLGTKRVWATASPPPAPAPARQHKQQPQQEQEEEGAGPVVPAPAPVLVHPTPVLRSKKRTAAAAGAGAKGQVPLQQGVAAWHASAAALASGPRPAKRACVQH